MIRNKAQSTRSHNKGHRQQAVYLRCAGSVPVLWIRASLGQEGELCSTDGAVRVWAKATLTSQAHANTWEFWNAKKRCGTACPPITSCEITAPIQNRDEDSALQTSSAMSHILTDTDLCFGGNTEYQCLEKKKKDLMSCIGALHNSTQLHNFVKKCPVVCLAIPQHGRQSGPEQFAVI